MTYQVYSTRDASTFVITRTSEGAGTAQRLHGKTLAPLTLWKTMDDLAIGSDPVSVVDANIAKDGFHVQRTSITFKES